MRLVLQANLEKQIKDLNVRIVDLETKSYSSSPRPAATSRRLESRIEELTSQLNHSNSVKSDNSRLRHSSDKFARDAKTQLAESDRIRQRLEEERKVHESQIMALRQQMDIVVRSYSVLLRYHLKEFSHSKRRKVTLS
jgi:myosin protein heavy chain